MSYTGVSPSTGGGTKKSTIKVKREMCLRPERGDGLPAEAPAHLRQGYGGQPSQDIGAKVGVDRPKRRRRARASGGGAPRAVRNADRARQEQQLPPLRASLQEPLDDLDHGGVDVAVGGNQVSRPRA